MAPPVSEEVFVPQAARRGGGAPVLLLVALLAFLLGGGLVGWLVAQGRLTLAPTRAIAAPANPALSEARVAVLEARLAAIDRQANAEAATTARAEALFTAFAARRAIEAGRPLGFIEGLLRQRFGAAQPGAVNAVIDNSRTPVTMDALASGLATINETLSVAALHPSLWDRMSNGFDNFLTLHREGPSPPPPSSLLPPAEAALREGRADVAIALIQQLTPTPATQRWLAAARRYQAVREALDAVDTAALSATATAQTGPANGAAPTAAPPPGKLESTRQ